MSTLYLIRHGKVAVPDGICYGSSNVCPVQPPAILAGRIRTALPEKYVLWSSPLLRCRLLAQQLGEPQLDARLMEMDFGDWEMCRFDAIERHQIDAWAAAPLDFSPPNGESVKSMRKRVLASFQCILAEANDEDIVIVSHAGPIRSIWGALLKQTGAQWLYKPVGHGEVISIPLSAVARKNVR